MSEAQDKKKFEEWARKEYGAEWRTITGWADASIIFLAGLKAGREEWEKKVRELKSLVLNWDDSGLCDEIARIFGKEPAKGSSPCPLNGDCTHWEKEFKECMYSVKELPKRCPEWKDTRDSFLKTKSKETAHEIAGMLKNELTKPKQGRGK